MKKFVSLFLSFVMVITIVAIGIVPACAVNNTIAGTDIKWGYDNLTSTLIFEGTGAIPDYDDCYNESGNFQSCSYPWNGNPYTSIEFSEGITGIGNFAFCNSSKLETVIIPDTVKSIGNGAFRDCSTLQSVTLSNEITEIPESVFTGCTSLLYVKFSDKTTKIGEKAFYNCSALKSIDLPNTISEICASAFSQSGLESLTCPENLSTIDASAFSSCEKLASVTFNTALTSIGSSAFSYCVALNKITLPNSLQMIETKAFYYCTSLNEIEIPYSVVVINAKSLGYTSSKKINEKLTITGYDDSTAKTYADENSIKFNSLGNYLNGKCGDDISWSFDKNSNTLSLTGTGAMYNYTIDNLPVYTRFADKVTSISIGDGITHIGDYAFSSFPNATVSVSDCKTLETIGDYAFYNVINFTLIPSTVTEIGEKGIGKYDESGVADSEFIISGQNFSCAQTFAVNNGFKFVIEDSSVPTEGKCGESVSWNYDRDSHTLTISGDGAMQNYTVDEIPDYLYHDIYNVIVDAGVTHIGDYAFLNSYNAKNFKISPTVETIGTKAIGYQLNSEKTPIKIDNVVITGYECTTAQAYAVSNEFVFNSKGAYTAVIGQLGDNVNWTYDAKTKTLTLFGTGATNNSSVESLPTFANYEIEKINIEEGITGIGDYCLLGIATVKEITIANSVNTIGEKALGYILDDENIPVSVEGLTINGYENSQAQVYSAEKSFITFNSLGIYGEVKGRCGENADWTYNFETKELEITGNGETFNYTLNNLADFSDLEIESIIVDDGITALGNNLLVTTKYAYNHIEICNTITTVGDHAFGFMRTEKLDEASQVVEGEYEYIKMDNLSVDGYISTPVYAYAKVYEFRFNALDEDLTDFNFSELPAKVNQADKKVWFYSDKLNTEALTQSCSAPLTLCEVKTGGKVTVTVGETNYDYAAILVGDVNGDATINSSDALNILQHSVQLKTLEGDNLLAGDIDSNGAVNSSDALIALQYTVGIVELTKYM